MILLEKLIKFLITIGRPVFLVLKKTKIFLIIIILIVFTYSAYQFLNKEIPDINLIYNPPKLSTKIFDRNGNLLYSFYEEENRTWISLDKIPKRFIEATLSIEDKDFYKHNGLSLKGILKATIYNFKKSDDEKLRGGSTITQQLVKNVFLTNEKSFKRKIKEAILTLRVERKLTKDEILERYFNQVSYGGEAYGDSGSSSKIFWEKCLGFREWRNDFFGGITSSTKLLFPFWQ